MLEMLEVVAHLCEEAVHQGQLLKHALLPKRRGAVSRNGGKGGNSLVNIGREAPGLLVGTVVSTG